MIVKIRAAKRSVERADSNLGGNLTGGLGGDLNVYQFDLNVPGKPLLTIAECRHDKGSAQTFSQDGQALPTRPCPLKPMSDVPTWMCSSIHNCGWRGNNPIVQAQGHVCRKCQKRPAVQTPPSDSWAQVNVNECVTCKFAGPSIVGTHGDRQRIVDAFRAELLRDPDLGEGERSLDTWEILWDTVRVV